MAGSLLTDSVALNRLVTGPTVMRNSPFLP